MKLKIMDAMIAMILCLCILFSFTACGSLPEKNSRVEQDSNSAQPQDGNSVSNQFTSDDIYSQQVEIEGIVYTFPLENVQALLENGWKCEKSLTWKLKPKESSSLVTYKSKHHTIINLAAKNDTAEKKKIKNCKVNRIYIYDYDLKRSTYDGIPVRFPNGVTFDSSYETVVSAYGQPDEEQFDGKFGSIHYRQDDFKISFTFRNNQIIEFSIVSDSLLL